jgi:ABC-type amino acid transport substrate-binding protein
VRTARWPAVIAFLAAASAPAGADLDEFKQRGTLRVLVVVTARQPEFICMEPGQPPGFDREILDGFAALQRLKLELVPVAGWDELVPALLKARGDVIAGRFSITESRLKQIDFTHEVFPTRHVAVTRRPHRVVRTVEELRQEKVGTVKATSLADTVAAAGVPRPRVDDEVPAGGLSDALRSGRVTAVVWGLEQAITAARTDPDIQLGVYLGPPGSLAYGVRREDPQLKEALDAYIQNVRRTPTWSRLVVKYFGENAPEVLRTARTQ